jgi:CRISPR/Cas system CSM-associated protein Csm2 small subunit
MLIKAAFPATAGDITTAHQRNSKLPREDSEKRENINREEENSPADRGCRHENLRNCQRITNI